AVVDGARAAGEQRVERLPPAVREAAGIPCGRAMAERQLEFGNPEAGPDRVDRHPHLAAEAGRERKACLAGGLRQRALARERFLRTEARKSPDEGAARLLGKPESAPLALGEGGDREIAVGCRELRQVSLDVGVDEEDAAGGRGALGEGEGLPFASSRQAEHLRPGTLGRRR